MVSRVSIGMPVYNGQRYVADAIRSLLAQTFEDFELIVSDNGSTDRTEQICRSLAATDSRIRFLREPTNRGASWNFNQVVHLSTGEYFRWAAADDLCAPEHLQRCVDALDADADVVLSQTGVRKIDANGADIGDHPVAADLGDACLRKRFRAVLGDWMCFNIFGLMRRRTLGAAGPLGSYAHSDGVLLSRLSLRGRFAQIDEPLFLSRRHDRQSAGAMRDKRMYAVWFDPANAGRILLPNWRILAEYAKGVAAAPVRRMDKLRCYLTIARETASDRRRLGRDLAVAAKMAWIGRRRPGAKRTEASLLKGGGQ